MQNLFVAFFSRILTDLRQKELLPLKLLFFVHSSTLFVLYPYLTIHMRELGINVEETAIMSAVTPVVAIIMPPIAGLIADRIGNFKLLLSLLSALSGGAALLLLTVPPGRIIVHHPTVAKLHMSCQHDSLVLTGLEDCDVTSSGNNLSAKLTVEGCGMLCPLPPDVGSPWREREFTLRLPSENISIAYKLNGSTPGAALSVLQDGNLFAPMAGLFNFTCRNELDGKWCTVDREEEIDESVTSMPQTLGARVSRNGRLFVINVLDDSPTHCSIQEERQRAEIDLANMTLVGCRVECLASIPREAVCTNKQTSVDMDVSLTFWMYLSIRVLIAIVSGTSFAMFEGAVIAILREHKADYGLQRVYATIGGMISSPLSGWLIDTASLRAGHTDFRPAFYLYAGLKVASAFLMLNINLEFKAPAHDVVSHVLTVLKQIEILALIFTCFILGTAWGYIESFLFWLLQDLGASRSLMGVTITVGGVAGLPLLVMSGPIIDRIGHANVLFIGFIFYSIRLVGYSLIYNPWMCLIFEAMESITSSLAITACVTYAAKLSTMATDSSIQGLIGGLYYGVGKGAGSLIGGYLMNWIGTRPTYRVFAVMTLVTGIFYFLFNHFYIRKRVKRKEAKEAELEKGKDMGKDELPAITQNNSKLQQDNQTVGNGTAKVNPAYEKDSDEKSDVQKENVTQESVTTKC